jgi:hypothetical protein
MTFDQTPKTDLINAGHSNEFHTEATTVPPADLSQFHTKGGPVVRKQDFHLEIGARFYGSIADDLTARHGDVLDRSFSHKGVARENDRKFGEDTLAIPHFHEAEFLSDALTGAEITTDIDGKLRLKATI